MAARGPKRNWNVAEYYISKSNTCLLFLQNILILFSLKLQIYQWNYYKNLPFYHKKQHNLLNMKRIITYIKILQYCSYYPLLHAPLEVTRLHARCTLYDMRWFGGLYEIYWTKIKTKYLCVMFYYLFYIYIQVLKQTKVKQRLINYFK